MFTILHDSMSIDDICIEDHSCNINKIPYEIPFIFVLNIIRKL